MVEDPDDKQPMDIMDAAVIMAEARERARRELTFNHPVVLTAWGLIYLFAYGTLWFSVRDQRPYQGPTPGATAAVVVIVTVALIVTFAVIAKTFEGVGGASAVRRRVFALVLAIGFIGVYTFEGALAHAGAGKPVIAIMGASGPILVTGLIYMASATAPFDGPVLGLGAWLVVVAACSGFAGPVGVWAVDGVAGGLGWLAVAAATLKRRNS
jgi:hypothetical protein